MSSMQLAAWLIVLAAIFSYINHKFLRLPRAIGLLLGGLFGALALMLFDRLFPGARLVLQTRTAIARFDFAAFVLNGVISFLIFAGALDVDVALLRKRRMTVLVLASAGVLISTFLIGYATEGIFRAFGHPVPFVDCLLFGALISPTDPVAVLAIMRQISVSSRLQVEMAGESLFNDGIGIVLFSVVLTGATAPAQPLATMIGASALFFLQQALGGCAVGLFLGGAVYLLLKTIDEPHVETLLSFALVASIVLASGYTHVSAPLGCAVAGLLIGHRARANAMKQRTRAALDILWSFTDFVLNAMLFLLLGLKAAAAGLVSIVSFAAIGLIIVAVIAARFVSIWIAGLLVPPARLPLRSVVALTWGGLRGGLSVALAVSLPALPDRGLILQAAYATVLFSLLVQGLTVSPLLRRLGLQQQENLASENS